MPTTRLSFRTLLAAFALTLFAGGARAQDFSIHEVPLTANHVLYDSFNGKVYASIPATAALNPNTVARINATTRAVEAYIPVAGGPDVLALSSDGSYLYVGTDTTSSVSRLNLTTNTVDQQFSLGPSSDPSYSYHAGNIVPLPGMPQSVAVTRDYFDLSPPTDGVAVFDNGVQRPTILNRGISTYGALTGSNSPTRIYAYDNETTDFGFDQLNLNASGVTDGQRSDSFGTGILSGFGIIIKFDNGNGLVYATNGTVVDPVALTDVGTYSLLPSLSAPPVTVVDVLPSHQENRVYFLAGSRNSFASDAATLAVYNQSTFQNISSFSTSATYLNIGDLNEISATKFVFRSSTGVEFGTPQALSSITVTAALPTVMAGGTDQFTATATYPDGSTSDITNSATWHSDNTAVATVDATGLARAVAAGTAHVTAMLGTVVSSPVALTVTPVYCHVLWDNADGRASIWNYDTASGTYTHREYGPYPGWTAKAIADGGTDGLIRVLWNKADGTASLWSLDNATGTFSQYSYGPYAGWTANAISVASSDLLWNNGDGRASLWSINMDDFGSFYQTTLGPYSDWTAKALANGPDNNTRLLWDNEDGRIAIAEPYVLMPVSPLNLPNFGPYPGWEANALSVAPDNTMHILWNNTNGQMSLWNYNITSSTYTHREYGPYPGYTAKAITDGSDGLTRVLWDNVSGQTSIWSLDNSAGAFTHFEFGPYPGWTAVGISTGS